jgi:paraquat-inducible protein A
VACVLFVFALSSPLMDLHAAGRFSTGTVFTGPEVLNGLGMEFVGTLVLLTLVVAPGVKLTMLLTALWGQRSPHPPRWLPWLYGWLEIVGPWAMVDVFLVGVFVAYTRLRALASVEIGPGLIAMAGVMLTSVAADASLDRHAVWEALDGRALGGRAVSRKHGRLVGCHVCSLVQRAPDGAKCNRCEHRVHHRKPNSVARAWSFMIAATLLYLPANAYPVMTVTRFGTTGPHTILRGVIELFEDHLWPLGVIVLLASVVVPVAKLGALAVMLVTTHRKSTARLLGRTRIFRVIAVIGRWSMIDIFVVTLLVAMVRMGFLANVLPGEGVMAFAGVVVLTMLATESFDPRLMWDAGHVHGFRLVASAIHSARSPQSSEKTA